MSTPALARRERHALCDLALDLGPDAPTLCGDWSAKQLVVHLLVRERDPIAAAGIKVPPLAGLTARAMRRLERLDHVELVERYRTPPRLSPFALGPVETLADTLEHLVHHEDLRRAQPAWTPRDLGEDDENAVWRALSLTAPLLAPSAGVPVRLVRSDTDASRTLRRGADPVSVVGMPSELALFVTGRDRLHDLDLVGPPDAVAALRASDRAF